ncbi:M48 family metallopeptidase [Ramlibacter sp. H39-3-26]|uniref:M48 family metallopeptidase n=1 Tax=Curvibacter soli TaxID=3031331 RepID=UPI0023DCB9BF|nr:M48 family metallopeptidase [Ramlibacter sp. H39-3-26]MDF1483896.1 M48 family metallopeptidase [Ramlibacter sp. H39-3-26]
MSKVEMVGEVDSARPLLRARWFDGQSSRPVPVLLRLQRGPRGPALHLHPLDAQAGPARVFAHRAVGWPARWGGAAAPARIAVDLRDAGTLEVEDPAAWQAAWSAAGGRAGLAERMQTHWRLFAAVLALAIAGLWVFYRWGTPWAAAQLTRHVPLAWEQSMAARALDSMDGGGYLRPSTLPAGRQAELRARFDALAVQAGPGLQRYPGYAPQFSLAFRSGMGPNAFALPGGSIVMTDALVRAAEREGLPDDALAGVLAHEMGHVVHRHTTRMVVEQGVLNVGLGLALGDVSSVLSTGGSLLTGLAYRRSHETEADCFALALMRRAQLPTAPMADLLLAIDAHSRAGSGSGGDWAALFSSHPGTAQRAAALQRGDAPVCAAR